MQSIVTGGAVTGTLEFTIEISRPAEPRLGLRRHQVEGLAHRTDPGVIEIDVRHVRAETATSATSDAFDGRRPDPHDRAGDVRVGNERRLDLTRLEPDTTDRQLVVDAPAVHERPALAGGPDRPCGRAGFRRSSRSSRTDRHSARGGSGTPAPCRGAERTTRPTHPPEFVDLAGPGRRPPRRRQPVRSGRPPRDHARGPTRGACSPRPLRSVRTR